MTCHVTLLDFVARQVTSVLRVQQHCTSLIGTIHNTVMFRYHPYQIKLLSYSIKKREGQNAARLLKDFS
jgi:hypothetical protein